MGDVSLAFVVQKPQYKGETSRLAITHAISYQTVEILLDDGDTVTPTLNFIGEGVLGLTNNQKAMDKYGITSTENHLMNCCLVDLEVNVCKEDMEKYGIDPATLPDAEEMGADVSINVVPMADIKAKIDEARHVLIF
jgi:sulfur relay (sulfurtransferase) DsrF/TusC family protein